MSLSPQQRAAAERTGQDVCCVAGPGSGKTRVLVERFAWLVASGTPPERILAITYTEKAATEIKQRLVSRFREREDLREAIERAPVSTVHGFCTRLLRERALEAGLDPAFRVLDDLEAEALRIEAMNAVLDEWALERTAAFRALVDAWACFDPSRHLRAVHEALRVSGGVEEHLRAWRGFDPRSALAALADEARALTLNASRSTPNRRQKIEQVEEWLARRETMEPVEWLRTLAINRQGLVPEDSAQAQRLLDARDTAAAELAGAMHETQRRALRDILLGYDAEYRRRKRAEAGLDFAGLEEYALLLLRDAEVRQEVAARFDAILMDELQDTNPVQWSILERLRRPGRFFAVGDVNQSIYGFRHAEPGLFEQYQRGLEAADGVIDRLEANYRSRPEIIAAAKQVADECEGIREHELRPRETPFPPKSIPSVEVQRFEPSDGGGEASEMDWIAYRLEQLKRELPVGDPPRPARWSDMAVLARTAAPFSELETALTARGIPCVVRRGRNFFEQQEVIDLTNLLRFLAAPGDEIALYALLRSPFFGIADQDLYAARQRGEFPPAAAAPVLEGLLDAREALPPDRLIARFADERGFLENRPPLVLANTHKFLRLLRQLHGAAPGQWQRWLGDLDALAAGGKEPNAAVLDEEDAVELMTIHRAKGLEFPIVVVAGIERGAGFHQDPLGWSAAEGLGAAWRLADEPKPIADSALTAIRDRQRDREQLESHRLLYVAMTRAEEHLILSWTKPGRGRPNWVERIERAFDLDWVDAPATVWLQGTLQVSMLSGRPPAPDAAPAERAAGLADILIEPAAPAREAAPAVAVTPLVHAAECPRRYFLSYVARWPEPPGHGGGGGRATGDEVHRLLGGLDVESPSAEALALRDAFLRSPLGQNMMRASRIEREFPFLFEMQGTLLRGVIDLWFVSGGEVTLVDYKTGRTIGDDLMRAYREQLGFYALALERLLGRMPARAVLFLLHQDREVEVPLDGLTRDRCRVLLNEWVEMEEKGEYPLRPGGRCEWCPYEGTACQGRATLVTLPDSRP